MEKDKMIEWIGTHSTGVSSRTMWCGLMGLRGYEKTCYGYKLKDNGN